MAKNAASPEPVRGSPLKYISEGLSYAETITMNVSQHVIITTQDKVSLWLIEHVKLLERRREWTTPLGILYIASYIIAHNLRRESLGEAQIWNCVSTVAITSSRVAK